MVALDLLARDYERAARDLAEMPDSGKEMPETFLLEGWVARAQGDMDKARKFYQAACDRALSVITEAVGSAKAAAPAGV